jgi:hypothetical protein
MKKTKLEKLIDDLDYDIMEWVYQVIEINFEAELIQDSTDLRNILERHLSKIIK